MLPQERHDQIIARLNIEGQVKVKELAYDFKVTEDCIRKDLAMLEKAGLLKRIHGGATQVRKNLHIFNVNERISVRLPEKKQIANKAIDLIESGTMIYLGISTVNLEIAKLIYQKNLNITVVTNMIDIMQIFTHGDCKAKLIFIGGSFNRARDGFLGALVIEQIQKYRFDLAFLGAVGINIHDGKVTTYDVEDGITKKEVINSSKKCYVVAESAKLNLDGNYVYAHLSDFSGYICEKTLNDSINNKIREYGIEIID
ncbi:MULTISPECIES: DeoR/GlpR family DNA-binding transcription regulator [Coprobacillaceae]|uniref:DeoR/GlpR family DNA-binding transcription regulator n=1 Tax=Coprobacillaceae TaxID=2810280 RepID=UPI000E556C28|nr:MULTISPECIES: DeoR/GlpR family DNA-binding transcription regulator [Coprobacillaceae]RHM61718.1 DeoR/GlpR transcriptional regulator [Coprobacillus sp. AF33-1AC]RHS91718.1 DeoR/GlpR transcriptional regulator [Erysipelatoclostridium sp. AM42-17]